MMWITINWFAVVGIRNKPCNLLVLHVLLSSEEIAGALVYDFVYEQCGFVRD